MNDATPSPGRGADDGGHLLPKLRDSEGHNTVVLVGPDGWPAIKRVCELVATGFVGPCPPGHRLEHIDGDLLNDRADNLRYVPVQS